MSVGLSPPHLNVSHHNNGSCRTTSALHTRPHTPCKPCLNGACQSFKDLGTVSDYKELLDGLDTFRAWKDGVLIPLVSALSSNYQRLIDTNHVLHQLAEMVNNSIGTQDLDHLMHNVDKQLGLLSVHLNILKSAPENLNTFKHRTMQKMSDLQARYASTMRCMQQGPLPTMHDRSCTRRPAHRHSIPRGKYPQRRKPTRKCRRSSRKCHRSRRRRKCKPHRKKIKKPNRK